MLKLRVMVVRKAVVVVHRAHRQEGKLAVQVAHQVEERRGEVQQEIIKEVYHKRIQLPPLLSQW